MLEDVYLIEDDNFLNKDVSELVLEDYYLFDMQDTPNGVKLYFYKDGIVFVNVFTNVNGVHTNSDDIFSDVNGTSIINKFEYTSGSLQELVEKFKEMNDA